jgi:hypothetical protein
MLDRVGKARARVAVAVDDASRKQVGDGLPGPANRLSKLMFSPMTTIMCSTG